MHGLLPVALDSGHSSTSYRIPGCSLWHSENIVYIWYASKRSSLSGLLSAVRSGTAQHFQMEGGEFVNLKANVPSHSDLISWSKYLQCNAGVALLRVSRRSLLSVKLVNGDRRSSPPSAKKPPACTFTVPKLYVASSMLWVVRECLFIEEMAQNAHSELTSSYRNYGLLATEWNTSQDVCNMKGFVTFQKFSKHSNCIAALVPLSLPKCGFL